MSQKSLRWRRALSPRKSSLQEEWVLRGLTLHQLKDIITDIYASKSKADARSATHPCVFMQAMLSLSIMYTSHTSSVRIRAEELMSVSGSVRDVCCCLCAYIAIEKQQLQQHLHHVCMPLTAQPATGTPAMVLHQCASACHSTSKSLLADAQVSAETQSATSTLRSTLTPVQVS